MNKVDIQNKIDNFEAVIASGDVKLVGQTDELKLYRDSDGVDYIYDGSRAYSQYCDEFAALKERDFPLA